MGPYVAMYEAMKKGSRTGPPVVADPLDGLPAGMTSKIRRAVAALDEEKAFYWERGGVLTVVTSETAEQWELSWRERVAEDHWSDIDKRMAEAYYETQSFADFLGLP